MAKLIIDNRSDLEDHVAALLVLGVVKRGRVSNDGKSYCLLTVFPDRGREIVVSARLNKKSDSFIVWNKSK